MKKTLAGSAAVLMVAASSFAAFADEASGVIASIDAANGTVTLDNGEAFILPAPMDAANLQVGQPVTIEFEKSDDGSMTIMSVQPNG